MSREELTAAYNKGHISRRVFMRGLLATGVSMGAAVAYAEFLSPAAFGRVRPKVAPKSVSPGSDGTAGSGTTGGTGGTFYGTGNGAGGNGTAGGLGGVH
jgi:hypothetical protein